MHSMLETVTEYINRRVIVCFVKMSEQVGSTFDKSGIRMLVPEDCFCHKLNDAVDVVVRRRASVSDVVVTDFNF